MPKRGMLAGLVAVVLGASGVASIAAETGKVEATAVFERLKGMAGEWHSKGEGHSYGGKSVFKVTAAGSVVMETMFPGSDHEMVNMYHLDGKELKVTHYCAAKNQPRLKLDRENSDADRLVFLFDGGTNFDPAKDMYMRELRMNFLPDGKVESNWAAGRGQEKLETTKILLSRP